MSETEVKKELEFFHKYFVLCPVDKASKNVAVIFYYHESALSWLVTTVKIIAPNIVRGYHYYLFCTLVYGTWTFCSTANLCMGWVK